MSAIKASRLASGSAACAGSIKLKGLSWSPLKVGEADIVQRPESGGDTVFKSEHVVLDSSLWRVITGKCLWPDGTVPSPVSQVLSIIKQYCSAPRVCHVPAWYPPLGVRLAGHAFEVVVGQAFLDWTSDEHGDSQIVKLLHVGLGQHDKYPLYGAMCFMGPADLCMSAMHRMLGISGKSRPKTSQSACQSPKVSEICKC